MSFSVGCSCGKQLQVTGGDAGSFISCSCGQRVEVPSLHELRHAVGMQSLSPDVIVNMLLKDGRLPEEKCCVNCNRETKAKQYVSVVCEREHVRRSNEHSLPILLFLFGIFFGWLLYKRTQKIEIVGSNIHYYLPIRICDECNDKLNDRQFIQLVYKTPLYFDLLAKFPQAQMSVVKSY